MSDDLRTRWTKTLGSDGAADGWADRDPGLTCKPAEEAAPPLASATLSGLGTLGGATLSGRSTVGDGTLSGRGTLDGGSGGTAAQVGASGFDLDAQIGKGGMGVVFKARQRSLQREIAVKFIRSDVATPGARQAFVAEALVNGLLDHPNIVPVHELGQNADGEVYLAMKLVGGTAWSDLLHPRTDEHRRVAADYDLDRHLAVLQNVANAVAFAHAKGIVHRDLKPENVMVGAFGEVLVMDWGIAVDIRDQPGEDQRTRHKSTVTAPSGTPSYLPPELAEGRGRDIGPWTDTYLLGAILHEVLTGHPPHRGATLLAVLVAAAASAPPVFPASVPAGLAAICTKALARDHRARYQSVAELQDALRLYLKHRESEKVAATARAALARAAGPAAQQARYGAYAEAIAGFRQAVALWDGNADARGGERTARLAYARAAREAGDLGLAGAQLDGLAEGDDLRTESTQLQTAIAAAAARERAAKRNKLLLVGAGAVIIIGLGIGFVLVKGEQGRTEEQRNRALANEAEAKSQRDAAILAQKAEAEQRQKAEESNATITRQLTGMAVREAESFAQAQDPDWGAVMLWHAEALNRARPGSDEDRQQRLRVGALLATMPRIRHALLGAKNPKEDGLATDRAVGQLDDLRWLPDGRRVLAVQREATYRSIFMSMPQITETSHLLVIDVDSGLVASASEAKNGSLAIDAMSTDGARAYVRLTTVHPNQEISEEHFIVTIGDGRWTPVPMDETHGWPLPGAVATADGRWLLNPGTTGIDRIDAKTLIPAARLLAGLDVDRMVLSPDGKRAAINHRGNHNEAILIDLESGARLATVDLGSAVTQMAFNADGSRTALLSADGRFIQIMGGQRWQHQVRQPKETYQNGTFTWCADGSLAMLMAAEQGTVAVIHWSVSPNDPPQVQKLAEPPPADDPVMRTPARYYTVPRHPEMEPDSTEMFSTRFAVGPDVRRVIAWSRVGPAVLMEGESGNFQPPAIPLVDPNSITWSRDGSWLVAVGIHELLRMRPDGSAITRVGVDKDMRWYQWTLSADGRRMVGLPDASDAPVAVIDWESGSLQRITVTADLPEEHSLMTLAGAVDPEGRWLALLVGTLKPLERLDDQDDTFDPNARSLSDGRIMAISLPDGQVRATRVVERSEMFTRGQSVLQAAPGRVSLLMDHRRALDPSLRADADPGIVSFTMPAGEPTPAIAADFQILGLDHPQARGLLEAFGEVDDWRGRSGLTTTGRHLLLYDDNQGNGFVRESLAEGLKPLHAPFLVSGSPIVLTPDGLIVALGTEEGLVLRDAVRGTILASPLKLPFRLTAMAIGDAQTVWVGGGNRLQRLTLPIWTGDSASLRDLVWMLSGRSLDEVGTIKPLERADRLQAAWRVAAPGKR